MTLGHLQLVDVLAGDTAGSLVLAKLCDASHVALVARERGRDKEIDLISGGAIINRSKKASLNNVGLVTLGKWTQHVDRWYPMHTWLVRKFFDVKIGQVLQIFWSKIGMLPKAVDWAASNNTKLPGWYCRQILNKFEVQEKQTKRKNKNPQSILCCEYYSCVTRDHGKGESGRAEKERISFGLSLDS